MSVLFTNSGKQYVSWMREDIGFGVLFHMHDSYEIAFLQTESFHVVNGTTEIDIESPCLILHRPFTIHTIYPQPRVKYRRCIVNFSQDFLAGINAELIDPSRIFTQDMRVFRLTNEQCVRITAIMDLLIPTENQQLRLFYLCGLLTEIESIDSIPLELVHSKCIRYISDVVRYIADHYMEDISAEQLAAMHYISVPKLNRDFRRYTQITIHEMLMRVRMQKAAEYLIGGTSVVDTAYKCGFMNESYFIRVFKKFYHITPHQYGKTARGEKSPP
ncbi:MAG: helix-turn-helix transcriptional regulator [Clostridia bacterium]|nr:helix-turn-helix transcriptional regulator [Clostridia bacterium]